MRFRLRAAMRMFLAATAVAVFLDESSFAAEVVPKSSAVGAVASGEQLKLISVLDVGSTVRPGGWNFQNAATSTADRTLGVKLGRQALALSGTCPSAGKGDFAVEGALPNDVQAIGCWMYVGEKANVGQVGLQFTDAEGEVLLALVPVEATGWKWIETRFTADSLKQAYPQKEKNGRPDQPLKGVSLIWFSKEAGRTELVVDALIARVDSSDADRQRGATATLLGASDVARGTKYEGSLLLTHPGADTAPFEIELSLQRDGRNDHRPLPDPILGTDLALGAKSWSVIDGKRSDDGSLTDGLDFTAAETPYRGKYWESAEQFVELPTAVEITSLGWRSADANWVWKVNVSTSNDGQTFTPVADLQNVELHKKWGVQSFPKFKPFTAKILKLHYHHDGEKSDAIRMPAALSIYNGIADEKLEIPSSGPEVQGLSIDLAVGSGAFEVIDFEFDEPLPAGQYALVSRVKVDDVVTLSRKAIFVEPAELANVGPESRFGLNGSTPSLAKELRKLGIGWVRFENFKWPMVSPRPHEFNFTGGTAPWHLNLDEMMREYRDAGLNVLPMMFLTPEWAAQLKPNTPNGMKLSQPAKNDADFGEFAYQSVARYGANTADKAQLKTPDGVSGLKLIQYYELGNEPDLNPLRDEKNPPTWGAWAGTMPQWWAMWEHGAKAVKSADPSAFLVSPGFAGATVETVDALRLNKTAEGQSYLDLVDVVSVHFYSGRTPPEIAKGDVNNSQGYEVTFIEHLKRLDEWRDKYKPTAQLWMTETGYDGGGPIGTNEWFQAARLPRVVALCLANGCDKVIVYRESGSDAAQHAGAGVVRNDHTRRPSWYTYATLIRQLEGATPTQRLPHPNSNVWMQAWSRHGETLLMVNAITGEATLDLELGPTTVVDAFGGETRLESTAGLKLSEYPLYLSKITDEAPLQPLKELGEQQERTRRETRKRDAQRRTYLFSFGAGKEPIGIDVGGLRYFEHVEADRIYSPENKFGFVGSPATRNDFRHWMSTAAEKHAVEFGKGQSARFDLAPGKYLLTINGAPQGAESTTLELSGVKDGTKPLTFRAGDETASKTIELTRASLEVTSTGRLLWRWMTLKEAD